MGVFSHLSSNFSCSRCDSVIAEVTGSEGGLLPALSGALLALASNHNSGKESRAPAQLVSVSPARIVRIYSPSMI